MMRIFAIILLTVGFFVQIDAQSYWTSIEESAIQLRDNDSRDIIPDHYATIKLELNDLQSYLTGAPLEEIGNNQQSKIKLMLPLPDGSLQEFEVLKSPVMMPGITAKYPNIQSYVAYALNGDNARFVISVHGFHGSIYTSKGTVYIDPYVKNDHDHYLSYYTKDHNDLEALQTSCGLTSEYLDSDDRAPSSGLRTENIQLRTYRLALSCTGEYGSFFDNVEEVLANMNIGVNRLNLIFTNELSIKVVIVDDNDKLINMDKNTDLYPVGNSGHTILGINTNILNQKIGNANYDLGHVWTRGCTDVGGVAYLGSVCNGNKGGGVTCIYNPSNISSTVVTITSHEMGHQFGAGHTFNNCGGNESTGSAFEPGSGSTIMSYGGLCGSNNIVSTNDDYYHNYSLQQIFTNTRTSSGSTCGVTTDHGNHDPVALFDYEDDFYIPISTPFSLTGDATDEDENDVLTYTWEEMDKGPIVPLGQPIVNSPLFRCIYPNEEKTRVFPKLNTIRSNSTDKTEVLPNYSRNLKFRFIVRDNAEIGGAVVWKQVDFKSTDEAGPFLVLAPNTNGELTFAGKSLAVLWDVANTNGTKVNTQFVNIYLSTDDGKTFPYLIAKNIANDGAHEIVVPNKLTENARIKIEAVGNIYFDMSDYGFRIVEPETGFYFEFSELGKEVCLPNNSNFELSTAGFKGYDKPITFELSSSLPDGISGTFTNNPVTPGESSSFEIEMNNGSYTGILEVEVRGFAENADTIWQTIIMDIQSNDFSELSLLEPMDNTDASDRSVQFVWNNIPDANTYTIEIATNPSFGDHIVIVESNITGNSFINETLLDLNTVYYWRVIATNRCESFTSEIFTLATKTRSCKTYTAENLPKNISASGKPTVEAIFDIASANSVVDVNVKQVKGIHDYVGQLTVDIISPSGTSVRLWNKKCVNLGNFNCGFDDESVSEITCPMVNKVYIPNGNLSDFNGEEIDGQWIVSVKDNSSGDGGVFQASQIEICADKSFNAPYIVNNNALGVKPANKNIIKQNFLLVQDADNTASELIFTIVKLPEHGIITLSGEMVAVGDQFTQVLINNNSLSYLHNGNESEEDYFEFTVIDGNGGWVPKTRYDIKIGDQYPNATLDLELINSFNIFPNPVADFLNVEQLNITNRSYDLEIMDLNGRSVLTINNIKSKSYNVNLKSISSGIYFLKMKSGDKFVYQKLSVVK